MKEIIVNKTKGIITFVDDVDADIRDEFGTSGVLPTGHVFLRTKGRTGKYAYLHRLIMERMIGRKLLRKEIVDHIDGNPLNNLRDNLRVCTQGQNLCNQKQRCNSEQKGYSFDPQRKRWLVQIGYQGKNYQRRFLTEDEAKHYAQYLREKLHGEFANHG